MRLVFLIPFVFGTCGCVGERKEGRMGWFGQLFFFWSRYARVNRFDESALVPDDEADFVAVVRWRYVARHPGRTALDHFHRTDDHYKNDCVSMKYVRACVSVCVLLCFGGLGIANTYVPVPMA